MKWNLFCAFNLSYCIGQRIDLKYMVFDAGANPCKYRDYTQQVNFTQTDPASAGIWIQDLSVMRPNEGI